MSRTESRAAARQERRTRRGEQPVVPRVEFSSYYGRPVLNPPVWKSLDIAGYFFLGGLAGATSVLAAGAELTGRTELAARSKVVATGAIALSAGLLVHDLGRPGRFYNMLRVLKPTSPLSVGSWLLAGYGPTAGLAAVTHLTGRFPAVGRLATAGAAVLGPAVTTYTAALIADTAVPAWHEGFRELPFVFAGSSATAAGGVALAVGPLDQVAPARRLALLGSVMELAAGERLQRRLGPLAEPYASGPGARYLVAGRALTAGGLALAVGGRRNRALTAIAGVALASASAATRFGVFHAGQQSARDPRYTVAPQRARLGRPR
jgi:hypothetical protein